ncbi:MAG: anti-sigma factor [Actinobacteria bacterium]|nr:anti-sigma factor [Actinomycetota bacterium]
MTMTHDEFKELVPIMALNALPAEEEEQVAAHVEFCVECSRLFGEYRSTAGDLAMAVRPVTPPADLKDRIMAQARQTAPVGTEASRSQQATPRRSGPTFARWMGVAAAAAVALVVIGFGAQQLMEQNQRVQQQEELLSAQREALDLIGSGETSVLTMNPTQDSDGVTGRVFVSSDSGRAAVLLSGLTEPSGDSIYTLWMIRDGNEEPVADFGPDRSGLAVLSVDDVKSDTTLAITLEPQPGNTSPQGPVLATAYKA